MREICFWVAGRWARNIGGKEKGRPLKGQFLSGANRRAVWLVDSKMLTLVHSMDLLILHVLQAAMLSTLCSHDWLYLFTSLLKFKIHLYRNFLFTMVLSVNYHCHCCYVYWISLCLLLLLFPHNFMHPLCSGIVKCSFCVVYSVWGLWLMETSLLVVNLKCVNGYTNGFVGIIPYICVCTLCKVTTADLFLQFFYLLSLGWLADVPYTLSYFRYDVLTWAWNVLE
jgi:hypothetical protein